MTTTRVRAILDAATPGPWFADFGKLGVGDDGIGEMDSPADATAAALSRNLLPAALDVVEAAQTYYDNLRDEVKRHAYWCEAQHGAPCDCGFGPFRAALDAYDAKVQEALGS